MKRKDIFRDTQNWYLNRDNQASVELVNFAAQNSGRKILDLGCATGDYCIKLKERGFDCTGVDINPKYVAEAREKGIEAQVMDGSNLNFPDNSFDTVLLFEVLEHVENPQRLLKEAKRVAAENVLITVPNCSQLSELSDFGLTYEHVLEKDHVNFFTKNDLSDLIASEFREFKVIEKDPIRLMALGLPMPLKILILGLYKLRLIKNKVYYRLYAVAEV